MIFHAFQLVRMMRRTDVHQWATSDPLAFLNSDAAGGPTMEWGSFWRMELLACRCILFEAEGRSALAVMPQSGTVR